MSKEILTLVGLEEEYKKAIADLTQTQINAIESDNIEMFTLFPRMRQARALWERWQEQLSLQARRQNRPSLILL